MELRTYQKELAVKGKLLLLKYNLLYLAMEMRVGKTFIAFEIAKLIKAKRVLFITKKRILSTVAKDFEELNYNYNIDFINYESCYKIDIASKDLIICDEAHTMGAYPKPVKAVKHLYNQLKTSSAKIIYLSGTPTPESYSQIYHQLWISRFTPFGQWPKFYKWAEAGFVNVVQKNISGYRINDYSLADKSKIDQYIKPFFLTYTQEQAEFEVVNLDDTIKLIETPDKIKKLISLLLKNLYYEFKDGTEIACDTAAKLRQKIHQVSSGTVIAERSEKKVYKILDTFKAEYIYNNYKNKKIVIFYLYNLEGELLKHYFSKWTNDPVYFNNSDSKVVFISQFQSGSRGINLSSAEVIIFLNIHFSSEIYQQARQRGQEKNKKSRTELHWLFSDSGIEQKIYNRVIKKQSYTTSYFRKDYLDV